MDVLDQSEVDALLSAVETGQVEEEPEEVRIFSRTRIDWESVEVRPYDFKRPERVSKDQMRALETLHEGFARNFGAALSGFLRTIVEIKVSTCDQMTYSEFIASLPNPTSFNLLSAEPLEGKICLEISPLIIYPIIDRLLGGNSQELFIPQRALTVIEMRLIQKIISRAIEALKEAWSSVTEVDFQLTESESNPHLVQIVPPNEVVIVVGLEIKMSTRAGTANLCIPYNVIEPVMEHLASQNWFRQGQVRGSEDYAKRIQSRLSRATVEVAGVLAQTTITLRDLLDLSEGDVLEMDAPADRPMTLFVEGGRKFHAHLGQFKGARAMKVVGPARQDDP